jgi:hypothetical protein
MLDRVGVARQAVTVEDHLARQVPSNIVAAEHGLDSFLGGLLRPHVTRDLRVGPLGDR